MLSQDHKSRIDAAIVQHPGLVLSWVRDNRRPQPITTEDLAAALLEVERSKKPLWIKRGTYKKKKKTKLRWRSVDVGLSITRLREALRCHRAKAVRLLAILSEIGLIYKAANYSDGRRGNVYRVLADGQKPPLPAMNQSTATSNTAPPLPAADDNDDPWG